MIGLLEECPQLAVKESLHGKFELGAGLKLKATPALEVTCGVSAESTVMLEVEAGEPGPTKQLKLTIGKGKGYAAIKVELGWLSALGGGG